MNYILFQNTLKCPSGALKALVEQKENVLLLQTLCLQTELKQPEQLLYFLPLGQTRKGSLPVQRQYQSKGKHWWQFAVNLH